MSKKKKMTYYPGCSSEGSGRHLDESIRAILPDLGVDIVDIDDWNCCGASVGHIGGGALPNLALTGRNLAKAQERGNQDVVTGCAACYLNTHAGNEKIKADVKKRRVVNEALAEADLSYDDELDVHHVMEVIVNDIGMEKVEELSTNKLKGLKVAGWVGCQTVRPFAGTEAGGKYATYEDPTFLDDITKAVGAEVTDFSPKTNCCGGSVAVMKPEKTLHLMKTILDAAVESGADVVSTPCPLCQTNLEMYQDAINKEYGTDYNMPVVFPSQLIAVAMGMEKEKDAGLQRQTIRSQKLEDMAKK
ncbi:MAG: CoB--CoM heterodisulfide reductase iron-sulfur subunit B family protein [Hyphomicrobiaceae bacterium]|nr:CoB--CoM heterodisulfide reductase iron-sulfur subunit B family protein [Hyphomicrobiaceae bacterium]